MNSPFAERFSSKYPAIVLFSRWFVFRMLRSGVRRPSVTRARDGSGGLTTVAVVDRRGIEKAWQGPPRCALSLD